MGRWTNSGFIAYSLEHYTERLNDLFREAFGEDFDIAPATPQGVLIQRLAELLYNTDMDGVEAFSLLNFNTSSGIYLDTIGALRGLPRVLGAPQTLTVRVTCNPSSFSAFAIPAGHEFALVDGGGTFVSAAGEVVSSPTSTITLTYSQAGDSTAAIGSKLNTVGLSQIQDLQVTGMAPGTDGETDGEYRARLRNSYPVAGQTIEYVQNMLAASPFVRLVGTNYNDTSATVGGLGPYTTEWMAVPAGSVDMEAFKQAVGKIIVDNKMPGAPTAGSTTVTVQDVFNQTKTVKFTIPSKVELELAVGVATPEATGWFDLRNSASIAEQISSYVSSLGIGDDVSYSRCMAPITADSNFDVTVFKIRRYVDAPEFVGGHIYAAGTLVRYKGAAYRAVRQTAGGAPDVSDDWEEYNEGWVINQNFTIGEREYPNLEVKNIRIGADIV